MRSMTGYARIEGLLEERRCVVEIRTVNHRYCDISLKLPRALSALELTVKKHVDSRIVRGRVDMTIQWESSAEGPVRVTLNTAVAQELYSLLFKLKEQLRLKEEISLVHLLYLRDVVLSVEKTDEVCQNWDALKSLVDSAIDELVRMREVEGEALKKDLKARARRLHEITLEIEGAAGHMTQSIRDKLSSRFQQLELANKIDENRLITEVFLLAERADITEELVRTKSHLQQFQTLMETAESVGRKLDFIVQELNREMNTIASKSNDAAISRAVVDAKSELEKIREQVQNVE